MITRRKFRTKHAQKRERMRLALLSSLYGVGALFILAGLVYGIHHPAVRITEYTFTTDGKLTHDQLSAVYATNLDASYWGLIPKNSTIFISTSRLKDIASTKLPRIASIETERVGITGLHTTIVERIPSALWCGDIVPPFSGDNNTVDTYNGVCYLVDQNGFIYDKAPQYSGDPFPRYYGSLLHAEPAGQQLVDTSEFERWQKLTTLLKDEGYGVHATLFADERDVELYLENGIRVIIPRTQDIETSFDRLHATLASDSIDITRPIAYLDMRFGTKAYVRYVDAPEE